MAQEVDRMVRGVLQDMERLGHVDLEASEMAIRASSHQMGGSLLEKLLNADGGGYRGARTQCSKGHRAEFIEYRDKQLLTALSAVAVKRAYYHCEQCQAGVIPKDHNLDIVDTSFSPGVRRMMGQVGGKEPFEGYRWLRVRPKDVRERIKSARPRLGRSSWDASLPRPSLTTINARCAMSMAQPTSVP